VSDPYATRAQAEAYERHRQRHPLRRWSKRLETWRVARAAAGGRRVLDVPCGAGRRDALVSCDRSAGMLALAREAGRRGVRADVSALPFRDGAFDVALCVRLLHHLDAPARRGVLRELRRVARRAVVTYFGTRGVKALRRRARTRPRTRRGVPGEEFAADCAAAGWRVESDEAMIPLWSEQRLARLVSACE